MPAVKACAHHLQGWAHMLEQAFADVWGKLRMGEDSEVCLLQLGVVKCHREMGDVQSGRRCTLDAHSSWGLTLQYFNGLPLPLHALILFS